MDHTALSHSSLGKKTIYPQNYSNSLLFAIPRVQSRKDLNIDKDLPFSGADIWNCYEISWLNSKGKPEVRIAELVIPCESPNLIESKSLKLYFNSYNNTNFDSEDIVKNQVIADLCAACGSNEIAFNMFNFDSAHDKFQVTQAQGTNLDLLDISCTDYSPNKNVLFSDGQPISETLYSNLLKSNCPITNQPDWASVFVQYSGPQINHESLLRYIVSYRNVNEFHEHCVEQIFLDINERCKPLSLTVYARYTRRGGLDINPIRTNEKNPSFQNMRLVRQ